MELCVNKADITQFSYFNYFYIAEKNTHYVLIVIPGKLTYNYTLKETNVDAAFLVD